MGSPLWIEQNGACTEISETVRYCKGGNKDNRGQKCLNFKGKKSHRTLTTVKVPCNPAALPGMKCQVFTGGFGLHTRNPTLQGVPKPHKHSTAPVKHSHNIGKMPDSRGVPAAGTATGVGAPLAFTCAKTWAQFQTEGDYAIRGGAAVNMTRSATYIAQSGIAECHSTDDDAKQMPTLACANKKSMSSCKTTTIVLPSEANIAKRAAAIIQSDGSIKFDVDFKYKKATIPAGSNVSAAAAIGRAQSRHFPCGKAKNQGS